MYDKLIVIEGTDCSGKETQSKILVERLKKTNDKVIRIDFPRYNDPTGKIIGGPLLGKTSICSSYFKDPSNVDPIIASLYYAADRYSMKDEILKYLDEGYYVILDRYVSSNMAHQGGKIDDDNKRREMYNFLEKLEYDLLGLPKPSKTILLYMPVEYSCILKKNRKELDMVEEDNEYLKRSENTYLELANLYNYNIINCVKDGKIREINDINDELFGIIYKNIKKN